MEDRQALFIGNGDLIGSQLSVDGFTLFGYNGSASSQMLMTPEARRKPSPRVPCLYEAGQADPWHSILTHSGPN